MMFRTTLAPALPAESRGFRNATSISFLHRIVATLLIVACVIGGIRQAAAQSAYPSRSITIIVPFVAGGPTDVVARIVTQQMAATLGQHIIIENIIGSGGTTAAIRTMRAPPDGYTLMMGHMGTHGAAVALYSGLAYSPTTDFEPIGMAAGMPVLILGRKDLPARTLTDFIAYARSRATPPLMAHAGLGSVSYASCLLFNSIVGLHPSMTSFQGTAPAINALAAGRVDYMCDQIVSALPRLQAGQVTAYATGSMRRSSMLPEVPTGEEADLPGFKISAWNALFAPKGTPPEIIATLNHALGVALDQPEVRKHLTELGGEIPRAEDRTPQALAALVKSEVSRWLQVNAALAAPAP